VEVTTHPPPLLRLELGPLTTITVSFEARGQYASAMEVFGTEAALLLPDANTFGGEVLLRRGKDEPRRIPYEDRGAQETRGIGLHELVESMRAGRPHRAAADLALHVLTTADAIGRAEAERRVIDVR
jgi:predicted dehydrogenase